MEPGPAISIVLPMFNSEQTVGATISTVLAQTFDDWELVVIDDGSTDSSRERVHAIRDDRIFLYCQANKGVSAARNYGISKARADIIAFLDADDQWLPDFLGTISRLASRFPRCGLLATSYFFRHAGNDDLMRPTLPPELIGGDLHKIINYFEIAIRGDPPFNNSSVALKKNILASIGGFPVDVKGGEDLLTWARVATISEIAYCGEPLAIYNVPDRRFRAIRTLPNEDPVGDELIRLLKETERTGSPPGLRAYIGHWYKIRASTYLARDMNVPGRSYTRRALDYSGYTPKLLMFYMIGLLPGRLSGFVFRAFLNSLRYLRGLRTTA